MLFLCIFCLPKPTCWPVTEASELIEKPSPIFLLSSIFCFLLLVQREVILRTKETVVLAFHYTVEQNASFLFFFKFKQKIQVGFILHHTYRKQLNMVIIVCSVLFKHCKLIHNEKVTSKQQHTTRRRASHPSRLKIQNHTIFILHPTVVALLFDLAC